jgi:hypothetical protein
MADLDPEAERSLRVQGIEIGQELAILKRELQDLEASQPLGLAADQAEALTHFAEEVASGADATDAADQQRIYALLRLRATVTPDPAGVEFGRHRYRIAWEGLIDIAGLRVDRPEPHNHPLLRKMAAVPSTVATMSPSENQNACGQSWDGISVKFIP